MSEPATIDPDTKDWTWVLREPCAECGYRAGDVQPGDVGEAIRANTAIWTTVLAGPGATTRPRPDVWSVTEYAAHVRDVHRIFDERLARMLAEDDPLFPNWDQDATAIEDRYDLAVPADVAADLSAAARAVADRYDAVLPDQLERTGRRSDGSAFTVASLGRYHLHDVVHHAWDVRRAVTVASYDVLAAEYAAASAPLHDGVRTAVDDLVARVGPGARVLEIGSGGGRDAQLMEQLGLVVRRTDVTPGFVALLRERGHEADVLDPLTDDLGGPYDGVWANASLLHVARVDLPVVLGRLAAVTRPGGVLRLSLKEGDGESWSTHGSIVTPRMFTYWRAPGLEVVLAAAGWRVEDVVHSDGQRGESWLGVVAYRLAS